MTTLICGTDRDESNSQILLKTLSEIADKQQIAHENFYLRSLVSDLSHTGAYGTYTDSFEQILKQYIRRSEKLIFVVPEYNGSYPGILKLFIDSLSPSEWKGKKAALVGLSSGRSGNVRGLDHLTSVLHFLDMEVLSFKPVLSSIHLYISDEEKLTNKEYQSQLVNLMERLEKF